MICEKCLHADVCGNEGTFDEALVYCDDFLGWIPVSERLPEEHGEYLVTDKYGRVTSGLWIGNAKRWKDVIAWMPLPEPYKAEKGDKE